MARQDQEQEELERNSGRHCRQYFNSRSKLVRHLKTVSYDNRTSLTLKPSHLLSDTITITLQQCNCHSSTSAIVTHAWQ
jgi:hypothetical protein